MARKWLGPTIEGVWGEWHEKTRSFLANTIVLSAISSQFSTYWGRIVDPHLRVTRAYRASGLRASMHTLLWIAKNRSRLRKMDRFYLRFYLRFSVRFLLAAPMRAETPTNWRKSEKNCRTLMSGMLPSNPPYLLLISLSSKDQCILVPKKKFLSQKIALFYLYILRYLSSTINFGFPS